MFKNLKELIEQMPDEKTCREYLAKARWEDGKAICPYCGYGKCYDIENGRRYKCGNKECYKKFSVTVGTIFEASNIQLSKWFMAIYLIGNHKKGISSYQVAKDIGVSQKCGWFMLHRIRELMRDKTETKLDNIVELDEVYMGGKVSRMNKTKRALLRENGETMSHKAMVMGMIERGGNLKLTVIGRDKSANKMLPIVFDNIDKDAVVITDGNGVYTHLSKQFAGHEVVNHEQEEYVRDGSIHTNTIEGVFSHFRRSIYGIYHQCSVKHLSRYCDETAFRYNLRKMKDHERFNLALKITDGRLKWKNLIDKANGDGYDQVTFKPSNKLSFVSNEPRNRWDAKAVVQIDLEGEIIARYPSIREACRITGLKKRAITLVLSGRNKTTGGYYWKYE